MSYPIGQYETMPNNQLLIPTQTIIFGIALILAVVTFDSGKDYLLIMSTLGLLLSLVFSQLLSFNKTQLKLPTDKASLILLVFIIWLFLTNLWSPVAGNSFYEAVPTLFLPLAALIGFWSHSKNRRTFQYFLILLLLATLWLGSYQSFVLYPTLHARGFYLNRNSNAIFMCMVMLPFAAQYIDNTNKLFNQRILGLILFISSFILSLTLCRGAVIGLMVGLVILFAHIIITRQSKSTFISLLAVIATGYIAGMLLNGSDIWGYIFNKSLSPDLNEMSSGRMDIWTSTWQMFLDKPFFGWGYNMFRWLYPHYQLTDNASPMHFVHNDFLQILMELGIVGLVLFLCVLFFLFKQSITAYSRLSTLNDKSILTGYFAAGAAMLTHSLVTFNLYQPSLLLLLGLYLGYILRLCDKAAPNQSILFIPSQSKYITASGYYSIVILLAASIGYFSIINVLTNRMVFSPHKDTLDALVQTEKATQLQPSRELYFVILSMAYINLIEHPTQALSNETKTKLIQQGIKYTNIAIEKNPYQPISFSNKIYLYGILPEQSQIASNELQSTYQQLLYIDPKNINIRNKFTEFLISTKQEELAAQILKQGINISHISDTESALHYLDLYSTVFNNTPSILKKINFEKHLIRTNLENSNIIRFDTLRTP